MRHNTCDARDRTDLIELGWVDQTFKELELCASDHHWHQICVRMEQASAHHTLGWKSMATIYLKPGYSGTTYM